MKSFAVETSTTTYHATIFRALRKKGMPIPIWIAAICLEHNATIATLDKHFSYVFGLKIHDFSFNE